MNKLISIENSIKTHLACFLLWPKDYLYLFTYSRREKVRVLPHDSKIVEVMNMLKEKIRNAGLNIPVHFIGSAVLGIAGQQDIDIFIESPSEDFEKYIPTIRKLFGLENRKHGEFIEWYFVNEGYDVELVLIDPRSSKFQNQMGHFNIFLKNSDALQEYEKIKLSADGLSMYEYQKRKLLFFYYVHKKYKLP